MLKEFFGGKEPNTDINPDEAVAIGVAIQAGILGEAHTLSSLFFLLISRLVSSRLVSPRFSLSLSLCVLRSIFFSKCARVFLFCSHEAYNRLAGGAWPMQVAATELPLENLQKSDLADEL